MPLWQQSPRSPFVSVVLLSRHSSVQLWGNMAHERASLSANSFLGWMRTCVYDAWHGAKSAWALFHKPRLQRRQRPGPPTLSPHVCRINLMSGKSLLPNPDSSGPCFSDADRGPESTDTKRLSCNSSTSMGGTRQGAGVKWFVFKDLSWRLTPCQLHKRIYWKWLACGVLTLGGALKTAAGIFNSFFIYN